MTDDTRSYLLSTVQTKTFNILLAGGLTGAVEVAVTYPIEYIKTLIQLEGNTKRQPSILKIYSGFSENLQKRGFFSLYRGSTIFFIGSVPKTAIRFGSYEWFCSLTQSYNQEISLGGQALCGLGAGIVEAVLMLTPMEAVKVKFIHDQRQKNPRYKGFVHGFKLIFEELGVRGLYKALLPTVIRQSSNQCIRFFVVEVCKDDYKKNNPTKSPPKLLVGCYGALAGTLSVFANTPIDVVMTRTNDLQGDRCEALRHCLTQIWQHEGVFGLYKGTAPRLVRVILDVSITFMCYDLLYEFLNEAWH